MLVHYRSRVGLNYAPNGMDVANAGFSTIRRIRTSQSSKRAWRGHRHCSRKATAKEPTPGGKEDLTNSGANWAKEKKVLEGWRPALDPRSSATSVLSTMNKRRGER
jgi:hypothetical protein